MNGFLFLINLFLFGYFLIYDTYPWWMIFVNILSIIMLMIFSAKFKVNFNSSTAIYLILFCLAIWLRLYRLDKITPGMWGDEITSSEASLMVVSCPQFVPFVPINFGHPTPLFYLAGWLMQAFGKSILTVRFVSVFFGALSIPLFYHLAKKLTSPFPALVTSIIFLFAYNHIVVSRLAYEMTAAMCFQLLGGLSLLAYSQKKRPRYLISLGIYLGLGLYTYLGFRTTAVAFFILASFVFLRLPKKLAIFHSFVLVSTIFISSAPLAAYAFRHSTEIWQRTAKISVFNGGLPTSEVAKELLGATYRTLVVTFTTGDPNPRHNPSRTAAYDYLSTLMLIVGLIIIFRSKKRYLKLAIPTFIFLTLLNDLLTLERIPEFHYYGLGHPNMLRLSLLTPIFYLIIAFTLHRLNRVVPLAIICLAASSQNYQWYFHQPPDPYNYHYNGAKELQAAMFIRHTDASRFYVSPTFIDDPRVKFFAEKTLVTYQPKDISLSDLPSGAYFLFDPLSQPKLAKDLIGKRENDPTLSLTPLTNPLGFTDTLVIRQF